VTNLLDVVLSKLCVSAKSRTPNVSRTYTATVKTMPCRCSAVAVPIWWNSLRVHPRQIRHKFKRLLKTFTFRRRERGTLLTDNLGTLANAFELSYLLTHIEVYFCHDDTVDTRSPIHRGSVQYQTQQRESRKARLRQDQCCNCLMRNEFCLV